MGFFLSDAEIARLEEKKPPTLTRKKATIPLDQQPRGCDSCPLQEIWPRILTPQMPMSGNRAGDILVLGEAPGETEDIEGEIFVGKTGKSLRSQIPMRHMERLAFQNTCRCRPPGNRTPTGLEAHCCSVYLEEDVLGGDFKAILGAGSVPLTRFVKEAPITHIHGTRFPVRMGDRTLWYYPIFHPSFVEHMGGDRSAQYGPWREDIRRFFKEVDNWGKPEILDVKPEDVICAYSEAEALALYERLGPVIGIDIETDRLRAMEHGSLILSGAFSDGNITFAFPVNHPDAPNSWGLPLLLRAAAEKQWVAHNAAFELVWFLWHAKRNGIDWRPHAFDDSMALPRIYHERETLLNLGIVTRIHLGVNIKQLTNINTTMMLAYSLAEILPYNGLDAWGSIKVFQKLKGKVDKYNYDHIINTVKSTAYMEFFGLPVDLNVSRALESEWQKQSDDARLTAKSVYEVKTFEREKQVEFNIGSGADVGVALAEYGRLKLPKTPSGKQYSTDDGVLAPLADENPLIRNVLAFREAQKHVSTYITPILKVPDRFEDGLLHPSYTTMLTATLRLSGVDVNIQNFPKRRHRKLRRQIVAPPGHVMLACDMGQLEARVYAMMTRDPAFCRSIIEKEDIHSHWLDYILTQYPDYIERLKDKTNQSDDAKVRKAGRDIIKSDFVFASLYGAIARSVSERTGIPLSIVEAILEKFWGRYSAAATWIKNQRKIYKDTGYITTMTGRRRYGILEGNIVINTPIQGTAADLVLDAQNELSQKALEYDDLYLHPRINIHDDLTFIIPDQDDKIELYVKEIAAAMTRVRFPWQIVPLSVEFKMGYNWDEQEEIAVITGDYVR